MRARFSRRTELVRLLSGDHRDVAGGARAHEQRVRNADGRHRRVQAYRSVRILHLSEDQIAVARSGDRGIDVDDLPDGSRLAAIVAFAPDHDSRASASACHLDLGHLSLDGARVVGVDDEGRHRQIVIDGGLIDRGLAGGVRRGRHRRLSDEIREGARRQGDLALDRQPFAAIDDKAHDGDGDG